MSRVRRVLPCVLGGLLVLSGTAGCASAPTELKLTVSGETSLLHYSPGGSPRPLVVVLHGLGSDGAEMSRVTGLSRFADRNGFSVVYPNARRVVVPPSPAPSPTATPAPTPTPTPTTTPTPAETSPSPSETPSSPEPQPSVDVGETPADLLRAQRAALTRSVNEVVANEPSTSRAWNAGPCCGGATADDVTYLRRVVAAVTAKVPVDRHRIYVVGLSNGGMMATRAICDAPDLFAAAGTVAGPYLGTRCGRPIWKHLHGGLDPIVPYLGGPSPGVPTLGVAVDWCRCTFPSSATEAARLRGYISTTFVPGGTHSWPTLSGPWHLDGNAVLWKAVSAKVLVDRHRIYVVGLSNGGMMATRAICDAPDLFAAAGTVAGPYLGTRCGRPVWKHLHGGLDPIVPYLGGASPGVPTLGVAVDWCRCVFPSSATEAARLRGYISTTYVPTGTHSWPTLSGPWHLDGNAVLWKAISAFRR